MTQTSTFLAQPLPCCCLCKDKRAIKCLLKAELQRQPTAVFLGKKNDFFFQKSSADFMGSFPSWWTLGQQGFGRKVRKRMREINFRGFPTSLWDIEHF